MMEEPKQICYVCVQEGVEKFVTEKDGRVHVFFIHKRSKGAGRPRKCDAGYNETESEFMSALEEGDQQFELVEDVTKVTKKHSKIVPEATTEVFVKMFMHTCQRCSHTWVTKKQTPLTCSKCTSRSWNMAK